MANNKIDKLLEQAIKLQATGRLDEAERCLHDITRAQPHHSVALMYLAVISLKRGHFDKTLELIRPIIRANPKNTQNYHILGTAQLSLKQFSEAETTYKSLIQIAPNSEIAFNQLGNALHGQGKTTEAIHAYQHAVELQPGNIDALYNLGSTLQEQKQHEQALTCFHKVISLQPAHPEAYNNLGNTCLELGMIDEALGCFQQALTIRPDYAMAYNNLGNAYKQKNMHEHAIQCYHKAIKLDPQFTNPWLNLGTILYAQGEFQQAISCCEHILSLTPEDAGAHNNLGTIYYAQGNIIQAIRHCRHAVTLNPDFPEAWYSLGVALRSNSDIKGSNECYRRALSLKPDYVLANNLLLFQSLEICDWQNWQPRFQQLKNDLRSQPDIRIEPFTLLATPSTGDEQLICSRQRALITESTLASLRNQTDFTFNTRAHSRIRIGYLSADFHTHATAYLIAELLELHDRSRFEIYAYSYGPDENSPMRKRLKAACDHFVDIASHTHLGAAQTIYQDEIDILIDLKGYTKGSRVEIMALRPAPIQVNWLGYPGTMGADFIDYIIADNFIIPVETEHLYSEKVIRLPDCYQINDRKRAVSSVTPSRQACGLPESGVVFCSFNQSYKILPDMFEVWMRILNQVPGSVLWLLETNQWAAENLKQEAQKRGIEATRLIFSPKLPLAEHLARYRLVDLCLDTYPVTSHTTASDALWVGCPLVTCVSDTFVSRVAGSLLHTVGLPELVTASFTDYEKRVLELINHPEMLKIIQEKLHIARDNSPLFDSTRFTHNLEAAFTTIWQKQCASFNQMQP